MGLKFKNKFKKSSQDWLRRQMSDRYVEMAKQQGYRSRAAFKLIEIDQKFKILKKNKVALDLGAAPGGWSQIAVDKLGEGNIIGVDLLEIDPIPGVIFLQGDFFENETREQIEKILKKDINRKNGKCDIVLSDMAANTCGDSKTDHLRIINLLEEALELAVKILNQNGCFIGKIFQGGSSDIIVQILRNNFKNVKYFKPESSRKSSSETYLVATGFKLFDISN